MVEKSVEKHYEIKGKYSYNGSGEKFTKHVKGFNAEHATENCLSLFGSKQKIKRRNIQIIDVKESKEEK